MHHSLLDRRKLKFCHGGEYRRLSAGRRHRPLSSRWPVHVVFKADKKKLPGGFRTPKRFRCTLRVLQRYAFMFYVKVDQFTIQNDHIHMLIRSGRRTNLLSFLKVMAGQVAQEFGRLDLIKPKVKLWLKRPFTRVVLGKRAYKTARDYLQLNELEVTGVFSYRKERLRGLSPYERENLWNFSKLFRSP